MITNTTWSVEVAPGAPDHDTVPWILEDKRLMHINKYTHTHTHKLVPRALGSLLISWVHTHTHTQREGPKGLTTHNQIWWNYSVKVKHPAIFCPFLSALPSVFFSLLSHSQHHVKRRTRFVALRSRFLCLNWNDSRGLRAFYREVFFFFFSLPCRNVAIRQREFNMLYFSWQD